MDHPKDDVEGEPTLHAVESLRLPAVFDERAHVTAQDIDAFLTQDERPAAALDAN
jgi:hypothetical protein